VPSGDVTLKRRCTYRPSVIYLIVNKLLSLFLSLYPASLSGGILGERRCPSLWASSRMTNVTQRFDCRWQHLGSFSKC
jgi:hypothetical protein